MNALFKDAKQAVAWKQEYEARGFVVHLEVRGSRIFGCAERPVRGGNRAQAGR